MARLHEAAAVGNIEIIAECLRLGDDINGVLKVDLNGQSCDSQDCENEYHLTPLHLAAYNNKIEVVNLLFQNGASLMIRCGLGSGSLVALTALEIAVLQKSMDLVILILKLGRAELVNALSLEQRDVHSALELEEFEEAFQSNEFITPEADSLLYRYSIFNTKIRQQSLIMNSPSCIL